jgi:PAS domain S-box-containing protein
MPVSAPSLKQDPTVVQAIRYILKKPFLRTILIVCLAVALMLVLYNVIYLSPSYRKTVSYFSQGEAQRLATHLIRILALEKQPLSPKIDISSNRDIIRQLTLDYHIERLSLFDSRGTIVLSSAAAQIGKVNTHDDFKQKVAKGELYSRRVAESLRPHDVRNMTLEMVEVYVPVMDQHHFLGAVAVLNDITEANSYLNRLIQRSHLTIGAIAFLMIVIVGAALYKAALSMMSHRLIDQAVNEAHDLMEQRVRERTRDLIETNKELQLEIMERRVAETNLRESEKRFRTLVDTIPYGIQEIDTGGTITFANPAHAQIYGYQPKELIGTSILDLAAGEHERQQLQAHLANLAEHQPLPHPWFGADSTKDGRVIYTQVDWNYKLDVQGRVLGLITVISDITHRKKSEKALLDNLNFMNTLIDTIPNPVFYKDNEGSYLGCNVAYAYTLGLGKEEILGRRLVDLDSTMTGHLAEHYHQQDLLLIQNPGVLSHEERIHCADGRTRDFVLFKATFSDTEDKVAGMVGIMLDITDHKRAEKAVKESKNLFDAFMLHLPGLAFMKDPGGRYIYVNDAFTHFTAGQANETVGRRAIDVWDAQTANIIDANDEKVFHSMAAGNHLEDVRLPDGRQRHLLTARFPIFQDDTFFALGGISIDITERTVARQKHRQLELQLQQTQKMEALGTLAGGIAHDFNNILAAIIGYTEIAISDMDKTSLTYNHLKHVLASGERARSLVKQILAFSRHDEMEQKPVQVKLIVKEVLKMLRASLPATIDIVQEIHSDGAVMADPTQLHQVMMNLGTNAGYAMGKNGGTLTVRLQRATIDRLFSNTYGDIRPGAYLKLTVVDTGKGIEPKVLNKIFDPFFTTKPKGEGTGMGLAVVHGIVTGLGGAITVDSTVHQGTRIEVFLPALPSDTRVADTEEKALPVGSERILFVDDEPFQTKMFEHMLGLLGYKVQTRNSSAEALKLFEENIQGVDLVITDMIMPKMTGDQLAQKMLALRPDLPIVLATGYSDGFSEAEAKKIGISGFALKPLVMEDLAKLIRQVLDDQGGTD